MTPRVQERSLDEIAADRPLRRRLERLTITDGDMKSRMSELLSDRLLPDVSSGTKIFVATIEANRCRTVGWALRYRDNMGWGGCGGYDSCDCRLCYPHNIYLCVDPRFRRRGLGAALMTAATKRLRSPIYVHPHDATSVDFFSWWARSGVGPEVETPPFRRRLQRTA